MSANINLRRLKELLAKAPVIWSDTPYAPLARYLVANGVLAVDTLTDDQCYELSDGQHKSEQPGWNMRDSLIGVAKGDEVK